MASKIIWFKYAVDKVLRSKLKLKTKYCKQEVLGLEDAATFVKERIESGEPFMASRFGFFELAVMRMYEFGKKNKYQTVMDNVYNCAGFFPNDTALGYQFNEVMKESIKVCDLLGLSHELCENYFMNRFMDKSAKAAKDFSVYNICEMDNSWTTALKGKKVLVVTPFTETVESQYKNRDKLFIDKDAFCKTDSDIDIGDEGNAKDAYSYLDSKDASDMANEAGYRLPEFELLTYKSLLTVGDLRDDRFKTWFDALEFMTEEILKLDFDIALLGCGAYGMALAARIKKADKQAIHMGGTTQLVFGIMGRRWDGSRFGGIDHMDPKVARFYNKYWTYPLEGKPDEANKVEYGPYWK